MQDAARPGIKANRLLVYGHIGAQFSVQGSPAAGLAVIELPQGEPESSTIEILDGAATAATGAAIVSPTGELASIASFKAPIQTWAGAAVGEDFRHHLAESGIFETLKLDPASLAPLMLIRFWPSDERLTADVLVPSRMRGSACLYVRVANITCEASVSIAELVARALSESKAYAESVRMESLVFQKFEKGTEIEAKVNLIGDASIWGIATDVFSRVAAGDFPGFVLEFANDFQRWQADVHMFEVASPPSEAGYISFSPDPSGTFLVHRKFFTEDALRRAETIMRDVVVPSSDLAHYLTTEYPGLEVRKLPSYTRVRFDVNIESTRTGHIYGVEVDEVTVHESRSVLRQVEIEYLRSRVHAGLGATALDNELERLVVLVEDRLTANRIRHERTHYSKLSFLKGCVDLATQSTH